MNDVNEATYRVDGPTLKGDLPVLLFWLLDLGYGLYSLPRMPARVPTHWGLSGQPDGWGPPWMNAVLLPLVGLAVYALLLFLPLIDPRRSNYALFAGTARFFRWVLLLFMIGFHVVVVRISLGSQLDMDAVIRLGIALLIVALGNQMGRLRQNFFFGIRVPWTILNEEVWNRTHRMGGRLWVAGGLLLAATALLPPKPGFVAFGVVMSVLVLVPIVYSWRLYQSLQESDQVGSAMKR